MKTFHILTDSSAKPLLIQALKQRDSQNKDEVLVLKDQLNLGPLKKDGVGFGEVRNEYISTLKQEQAFIEDLENLMKISTQLSNFKEVEVCFWRTGTPRDLCAYFWMLHFLKKHAGRIALINIAGLPFLDENNQLVYPNQLRDLPVKEFVKALKLQRTITATEWETDQDEWAGLVNDNAELRILEGTRKIKSVGADYYDEALLALFEKQNHRIGSLVRQAKEELNLWGNSDFIRSRFQVLETTGRIKIEGSTGTLILEENEDADAHSAEEE